MRGFVRVNCKSKKNSVFLKNVSPSICNKCLFNFISLLTINQKNCNILLRKSLFDLTARTILLI